MGRSIIKLEDKYLIWSSVVDRPITGGMTLEELELYMEGEYGLNGLCTLSGRVKRADYKGTSSLVYSSLDEEIAYNRAGPNESCLTKEELIEMYVRNVEKDE